MSNTYVEFLAINKKNNEIWLGQNVQVIMKQGQVSGYQALARDITKQRKVEEKLHKAATN
ncbi:MAG: PAS domain S-box protein [Ardenticatenaceae bacterium]|nr:PAS domain S-box protein [Ardenticatenaceae bacterium]